MKYLYILIFAALIISCEDEIIKPEQEEKEIEKEDSLLLYSIYQDTSLLYELDYNQDGKISRFYSHFYHYHNTGGPAYWDHWVDFKQFNYENGRLDNVGDHLKSASKPYWIQTYEYNENGLPENLTFYWENDIINTINIQYNDEDKIIRIIKKSKGLIRYRIFEYRGDNVSKLILYYHSTPERRFIYELEYDTCHNPLYNLGIIGSIHSVILDIEFISKNNILRYTYNKLDTDTLYQDVSFSYEYNEFNLPVSRLKTTKYYSAGMDEYSTYKNTFFYHYKSVEN